jgi:hypothetical protein
MAREYRKFEGTNINWLRTQGQIIQFLQKEGIQGIRFTNLPTAIMLEFAAKDKKSQRLIPIRMQFPLPQDNDKEINRIYRVFFWYLTNKFEAIRSGIVEEITREFLPFIAYKTRHGVDTTLYEALQEEGQAILGDENFPLLGRGGESNDR